MTAFRKGISGNPKGRPRGVADWRVKLRGEIEAHAPELVALAIQRARDGDGAALRMLLDRVVPPLRATDAPTALELPEGSHIEQADAILAHAAAGDLPVAVARDLIATIADVAKLRGLDDIERRLAALETRREPETT